MSVDRPGFVFNPTNCSQLHVTATITAAQGASANVSSPFAVAGCRGLPFKPKFSVSTKTKKSKADGTSLHVVVSSTSGQANIASVHVELPKKLPSRLSTLHNACPEATFDANPGSCPAASDVGTATASTPVLSVPLTGPAYLVSHGGAAFPDLVVVLQGEGVTIGSTGATDIKKGDRSTPGFETVPDAPNLLVRSRPAGGTARRLRGQPAREGEGQLLRDAPRASPPPWKARTAPRSYSAPKPPSPPAPATKRANKSPTHRTKGGKHKK